MVVVNPKKFKASADAVSTPIRGRSSSSRRTRKDTGRRRRRRRKDRGMRRRRRRGRNRWGRRMSGKARSRSGRVLSFRVAFSIALCCQFLARPAAALTSLVFSPFSGMSRHVFLAFLVIFNAFLW